MIQPDNNYLGFKTSFDLTYKDSNHQFSSSNQQNSQQNSPLPPPAANNQRPFLAKVVNINIQDESTILSGAAASHKALFVEQNDIVSIEERLDDNWFLAKIDQQNGRLAKNNCQLLDNDIPLVLCQYLIDNQFYDLYVCFASFVAQDVGDLSVTKGDIIVANKPVNEHWMQGQVCYDGQVNSWPKLVTNQQIGTFPLNHCWRLDSERVKAFCHDKICLQQQQQQQQSQFQSRPHFKALPPRPPFISTAPSSSLSSKSSSLHSSDFHNNNLKQMSTKLPPTRPSQPPRQVPQSQANLEVQKSSSLLTSRQQDKLKGWLHTVKKKTARFSTRITASLGLISLTRDEEFEKHYENFKHIEKTIKGFIKNLSSFVEHFENFLIALQNTSENLADFYRDKSHNKELDELRRKNKALNCEHFHAFKRTVDRQVIAVISQLLQKFTSPYQLINKRSAKLLDYDTRTKELDSCRDLEKKASLRDQYVIAKDLYDRINKQLIEELPMFNQFAIDIFRECVLVLLEGRRNLILAYSRATASLLNTPLMLTYTASDVASSILMSCDLAKNYQMRQNTEINEIIEQERKVSGQTSGHDTGNNSVTEEAFIRPHSSASQFSSEFEQLAIGAREISSTPLSQVSGGKSDRVSVRLDEPDGEIHQNQNGFNEPRGDVVSVGRTEDNEANLNEAFEVIPKEQVFKKEETKRKKRKFQIYIASWPFVATGPNQLTIACQQPLKLVKDCDECGNPDWSLVQDKKGQLGYVPSSYIKKKE